VKRTLLLALLAVLCNCAAASAATVTEFFDGVSLGSSPFDIAAGPDGNLWFTESEADQVGRITPSGEVTEFSDGIELGSGPTGITAGPDGNMWFTEYDAGRIARITPAGDVTEFDDGITAGSSPRDIVAGPDGNLWYTDTNGRRIGRITTAGVVTEFSVDSGVGGGPQSIAVGADGNLWFTEFANGLGRMTTGFSFTRFPGSFGAEGIATGADGNLWVTGYFGPIQRITTSGVVTGTFTLPSYVSPEGIAAGPDGNLWFTDSADDSIGRITPAGDVILVTTGVSLGSDPRDITAGPDGNLWFTEQTAAQIGRITPSIDPPTVTIDDATSITATTAALNGSVDTKSLDGSVRFDYGTTDAYGSQTPAQFASVPAATPVSAALTGLQPATTYHYRLVATSDGGDAQSPDRTFTTSAQAPPPAPAPACSNGRDDDRDGSTDGRDPRCHADGDPRNSDSYRPLAASESPRDDPVLACSAKGLAIVAAELVSKPRRVRIRGLADPSLVKRQVGIYLGPRRVGNARVQSDGSFVVTFAVTRGSPAGARYQASLDALRSQTVTPQRRLTGVRLSVKAGRVVLSGSTTGRRPRSVELLGRAGGCGAFARLATARVSSSGAFRLTAAAPTTVDIATYRVRIAATGAAGAREATAPRAIRLR
jgi:streptogramin lyase